MWSHTLAYLATFLALSNCATLSVSSEDELVAVVTLSRHGDTAPSDSFPTDKYFDKKYWPNGFSQLTNVGKMRQFLLGKSLRSRYASFLPEKYAPEDIYVRSTDRDETLMSASLILAGLYSPKEEQVWNGNLPWQPIPVHTIPADIDDVLVEDRQCKKYEEAWKKVHHNEFYAKVNQKHAKMYEYLSDKSGRQLHCVKCIKNIRSIIYAYESYNASLVPEWAKPYEAEMDEVTGLCLLTDTYTEEMKRLRTGPFFRNVLTYLDNVVKGKKDTVKLYMLSASENEVASVLNSLGAFDLRPVDFSATVVLELRRTNGSFYVNLLYKTNSGLKKLSISTCGLDCPYNKFTSIVKPITMDLNTWTKACSNE